MAKKFFFTVNLVIRSDANIRKAIDSIISDEKFFRQNVQLILIDTIGTPISNDVCAQYSALHPDNVFFIDAVGESIADGYNHAGALSVGKYISFIDNYGTYCSLAHILFHRGSLHSERWQCFSRCLVICATL